MLLAGLPFVRMVGLTGSVAQGQARAASDIDFFIVTVPGRLFSVRLFVTFFVHLLGLRRRGRLVAGRICLNRYQTLDVLEILPHTRYHAHDLSQLIPLVDLDQTYQKFREANQWMAAEYQIAFPGFHPRIPRSLRLIRSLQRVGEWLLTGRLGDWCEKQFKRFQLRYQAWNSATSAQRTNIVVTDSRLLFHPPKE